MSEKQTPQTPQATPHWRGDLLYYTFPLLQQFSDRLTHGFSTRLGGVSGGGMASLNLGISRGDDPACVAENHARFSAAVGYDWRRTVLSQQTHSTQLRLATAADAGKGLVRSRDYQHVDGLITATQQLPLMTQYADCTPLLFYAPDRHIAATAHAGWRGTAAGMARHTAESLAALGCDLKRLHAVIGPAAGPCCYQVDAATAAHFRALADEAGPVVVPDAAAAGKFLLDLWRANRCQLLAAGLLPQHVAISGLCTICHADIFYSHRVQGEARGALSAVIMLK